MSTEPERKALERKALEQAFEFIADAIDHIKDHPDRTISELNGYLDRYEQPVRDAWSQQD